jgi:predicted ester cyclase
MRSQNPHELDPHDAESVQVVRDVVERVWRQGDAAAIEDLFGPQIADEIAEHHRQLKSAFPDLTIDVDDMIVDGDTVAARLTLSGTHAGTFAGVEPTNTTVTWCSMRWYEVHQGRVVETWAMQDRLGLLQQLGALPKVGDVSWASALQS